MRVALELLIDAKLAVCRTVFENATEWAAVEKIAFGARFLISIRTTRDGPVARGAGLNRVPYRLFKRAQCLRITKKKIKVHSVCMKPKVYTFLNKVFL